MIFYAPRLAEQNEAGRGAFYFLSHSDLYQVTTWELFEVTMYTAHISSIPSKSPTQKK